MIGKDRSISCDPTLGSQVVVRTKKSSQQEERIFRVEGSDDVTVTMDHQ
jgi:hypothetical protein